MFIAAIHTHTHKHKAEITSSKAVCLGTCLSKVLTAITKRRKCSDTGCILKMQEVDTIGI